MDQESVQILQATPSESLGTYISEIASVRDAVTRTGIADKGKRGNRERCDDFVEEGNVKMGYHGFKRENRN